MSLIAELQRRKVFKVAVAYGVVAWLVIQVASTIAPQLNLPEWAPRFITLLLLLGFPIAMVLAWIFDNTPEGLKVESSNVGNKRMFLIAGVLAVLAIGWYWQSWSSLIYHDKLIRQQLGDDPRYQALMRQIESRFEKL